MRGFMFRSKTNSGHSAKFYIFCKDENKDLAIVKLIFTKELISSEFQCVKVSKWGNLYCQIFTIKYDSFATICKETFRPLNSIL